MLLILGTTVVPTMFVGLFAMARDRSGLLDGQNVNVFIKHPIFDKVTLGNVHHAMHVQGGESHDTGVFDLQR